MSFGGPPNAMLENRCHAFCIDSSNYRRVRVRERETERGICWDRSEEMDKENQSNSHE